MAELVGWKTPGYQSSPHSRGLWSLKFGLGLLLKRSEHENLPEQASLYTRPTSIVFCALFSFVPAIIFIDFVIFPMFLIDLSRI